MQKQVVKVYAILISLLALGGLFINDGHLFGLMNADMALDMLRLALAAFLLYVGFRSTDAGLIRSSLVLVGALYIGMALIGLVNPQAGGLLPNGLTGFDIVFHLLTGVAALGLGLQKSSDHAVVHG